MRKLPLLIAIITIALSSCNKLERNEKKYLEGMLDTNYEKSSQAFDDFCHWLEKDRSTMTYDFKNMREQMGLKAVTSADGRLRCYSWETTRSDTLHIYANITQWTAGENFVAYTGPINRLLAGREANLKQVQSMAHSIDTIFTAKMGEMDIYLIVQSYINRRDHRRAFVSASTISGIRLSLLPFFFDGTEIAGSSEFIDDGTMPIDKLFKWDEKAGKLYVYQTDDNYHVIPGKYIEYQLGNERFTRLTPISPND